MCSSDLVYSREPESGCRHGDEQTDVGERRKRVSEERRDLDVPPVTSWLRRNIRELRGVCVGLASHHPDTETRTHTLTHSVSLTNFVCSPTHAHKMLNGAPTQRKSVVTS